MKLISFFIAIGLSLQFAYGENYTIENQHLGRSFVIQDNSLRTTLINNKIAHKQIKPLASPEFGLRISQGTETEGTDQYIDSRDFKVVDTLQEMKDDVQLLTFKLQHDILSVELVYSQKKDDAFLHKQLKITALKPICIERIDIDSLKLQDIYQAYTIKKIYAQGVWKTGLGQPLYTSENALFMGTEFPASYNFVSNQTYYCGYLYGHKLKAGDSFVTYKAVLGAGDDSKYIQDTFFDYINKTRIRPLRLQIQYNSWFDFWSRVTQKKFKESVKKNTS